MKIAVRDVRVCFVGDSITAGTGDPSWLGWVWRLGARTQIDDGELTVYNLGVCRQTSSDISQRWFSECSQRLPKDATCSVVFSFGVNDTSEEAKVRRIPLRESVEHLAELLLGAQSASWNAMMVGPTPVSEPSHNQRLAELDEAFVHLCRELNAPYVPIHGELVAGGAWMEEISRGDGAHPGAGGYEQMASIVWPYWSEWIVKK